MSDTSTISEQALREKIQLFIQLFIGTVTIESNLKLMQELPEDWKSFMLSKGIPEFFVDKVRAIYCERLQAQTCANFLRCIFKSIDWWSYSEIEVSLILEICSSLKLPFRDLVPLYLVPKALDPVLINEVCRSEMVKEGLFKILGIKGIDTNDEYRASKAVQRAFFEDYRDHNIGYKYIECIDGYLNRVAAAYKQPKYYAPVVSIIQSSGMGKSRTFKELSCNYLTFYVVFRSTGEVAFPTASKCVMDYLMFQDTKVAIDDLCAVRRYISFLKACSDVAMAVADLKDSIHDDFFEKFFLSQVNENPDKFWSDIIQKSKHFESQISLDKYSNDSPDDMRAFIADQTYTPNDISKISKLGSNPLKLLFVLDEVHLLFDRKEVNKDLFFNFVRALQIFDVIKGIVCATADTVSKLSEVMPITRNYVSGRVAARGHLLFPPFYRIGTIDCNVDDGDDGVKDTIIDVVDDGPDQSFVYYNLAEIQSKERISKYGRPLWWKLLKSGVLMSAVINLAKEKLVGLNSVKQLTAQDELTVEACLAILSSRVQFAQRPSFSLASELAASHLAVVDYISPARDVIFVSYTSEPIVAEAAALIMEDHLALILGKLESYFRGQFIERGLRSEYMARLVCLLAADKISQRWSVDENEYKYNQTVPCNDYLLQLAGENLPRLISENTEQVVGINFTRFLEGKIFLTHFISCNYEPKVGDLVDFFKRGAGVLCKNNQTGVDMIIPVLLPPDDNVFHDPTRNVYSKTTPKLDLAGTAKISHHDDLDIPESYIPFPNKIKEKKRLKKTVSGASSVSASPAGKLIELVLNEPKKKGSPNLFPEYASSPIADSPSNNWPVSPFNMSYICIQVKYRSEITAESLFKSVCVIPPTSLQLHESMPYCSLLMTHADGEDFKAQLLANRKAQCLGIGVQGFNGQSLGPDIAQLLEGIVSPDMSYFGKYDADIIKAAYSHMHPLTHWNKAELDEPCYMEVCPSSHSEPEDLQDSFARKTEIFNCIILDTT